MSPSFTDMLKTNTMLHLLRRSFQQRFDLRKQQIRYWQSKNPYLNEPPYSTYDSPYPVMIGIIQSFFETHQHYISACKELNISYRVIRIDKPDWISQIEKAGCTAFVVWPNEVISQWKDMYDERLRFISHEMGKIIYPTYDSLWIYESKRRMSYWLDTYHIPHAKTWIFYSEDDALAFSQHCDLPIVIKANLGSGANGVYIQKRRRSLKSYIRKCFRKGLPNFQRGPWDKESGFVILQEYIADVKEWRCLRIGEMFFAHQKLRNKKGYHSGSDLVGWYNPPIRLLDFIYHTAQSCNFFSIDLDVFEKKNGDFLVNEIQALFGAYRQYQMLVNGIPGCYIRLSNGNWQFNEGMFCQNACSNLRILDLMSRLGFQISYHPKYSDSDLNSIDKKNSIENY